MRKRTYVVEIILVAAVFVLSACTLMDLDGSKGIAPTSPVQAPKEQAKPAEQKPVEAPQEKPVAAPGPTVQLPGEQWRLNQALEQKSGINYRVVLAEDGVTDKTAYLDTLGDPAANELVIVLFPDANYDIRFAMGSLFWQRNVSVDDMLDWVRTIYLPAARQANPAGGLANLIMQVNLFAG